MNEHLIPMFTIRRDEIVKLMEEKFESVVKVREKVNAACEGRDQLDGFAPRVMLDREQKALKEALELFDDIEGQLGFMKNHLGEKESWDLSAAQLLEIRRSLEPVNIDLDQLRLALEPGKQIQIATHNYNGRTARW